MSEQEHFETTDPAVLNVKLTSDPSRVLHPTLSAFCLMVYVVKLARAAVLIGLRLAGNGA